MHRKELIPLVEVNHAPSKAVAAEALYAALKVLATAKLKEKAND